MLLNIRSLRSLHVKVIVLGLGILALSLLLFVGVSVLVMRAAGNDGPLEQMERLQGALAEQAVESGGIPGLGRYLETVRGSMPATQYLTDLQGKDLFSGEDRSELLARARRDGHPTFFGGRFIGARLTPNKKYWLILEARAPIPFSSLMLYYLLVFMVVGALCWLFAVNLVSPLKRVSEAVERFGRGDLSARLNSDLRDEIGDVARSFDGMADRVQSLLTAERRLLQDISHELRSPLARLRFAAELVRTAPDPVSAADRLKREIQRLTELVDALIQATQAEGDPASRPRETVPISKLLGQLVEDCQMEASERGCRLQLTAADNVHLRGDRELLRRAFENVVRNAIRYTPPNAGVDVQCLLENPQIRITVRDYGPGVPESDLQRIFRPFFRVDESRDNATGGVGLGLAIANRAVALHHGVMEAENAGPGLLVKILLPMGEGPAGG